MIFKEHKNPQSAGLWLTTHRCLEIWDVLKTTNKKLYTDDRIFKHLLRIIQFYNNRLKADIPIASAMTTSEKNIIETDVSCLIHEHRIASKLAQQAKENMKNIYVKPEFAPRHVSTYFYTPFLIYGKLCSASSGQKKKLTFIYKYFTRS